jgi:hypothetical protein
LADQHQLVFGLAVPGVIFEREAFAAEVKHMTLGAFVKPEKALSSEDARRQLVIQKVLELLNREGFVTLERQRGKAIIL